MASLSGLLHKRDRKTAPWTQISTDLYAKVFSRLARLWTVFWITSSGLLHHTCFANAPTCPDMNIKQQKDNWSWYSLMVAGEWWNMDTLGIEQLALKTGGAPNVSNAATINGFPGPLYNQSASTWELSPLSPYSSACWFLAWNQSVATNSHHLHSSCQFNK